jgi:hypothetical protein
MEDLRRSCTFGSLHPRAREIADNGVSCMRIRIGRLIAVSCVAGLLLARTQTLEAQQLLVSSQDAATILGKDIEDIADEASRLHLEVDRSLNENPLEPLPQWIRSWRRTSIVVNERVGELTITRLLTIGVTPKRKIWYVDVPTGPGSQASIGPVAAGFAFADCERAFGLPWRHLQYAPGIRIDWWQIGGRVVRVSSRTREDALLGAKVGELDRVMVYDPALAPARFKGGYEDVMFKAP